MDIKQLQYFVRIAELGSVSRAADALAVAQPALSRQVRLLEVELGVSVFIRHGRGVRLTESGKTLYEHALGILHQCDRTRALMQHTSHEVAGKVAVGLPPSLCKLLAAPLLSSLQRRHPGIRVTVREGLSSHLMEWLLGGSLDCALVYNAVVTPEIIAKPLGIEPRWLVSSKLNSLHRKRLNLEALAALPLILPSRPHATRLNVDRALADIGKVANVVAEVDGVPAILELVRGGFGHAVLPLAAVKASGNASDFVTTALSGHAIESKLSLVTAARRPESNAQRAVSEELSNLAIKEISQ
ncbi:MAG: LysR family transcriptional regulator [Burkholderiales bacterium]|nr:MAG: LysR family transcriptional regulator [Burkholderiales bacterium]